MSDCWEPDVFEGGDLTDDELQGALEWGSAVWHADPTADPTETAKALGLL